ncbi:hypothetical protein ACPUVO_10005 [Pseudocolwellia sp. HL-MZ19]|uniref:hypothetical protein n=1 Tax=Pseudocolwellia sp. HL-MZ19 TaxID=3400846 RepID=UPI003CFB0973
MKYFYLFLFIVYLPLTGMYLFQRGNKKYDGFTWNTKNRIGVWLAILLALIVLSAKIFFPYFVYSMNNGWDDAFGDSGGEISYCFQWLAVLSLLIFPHLFKKSNWSNHPTATKHYDRFNASGYWYVGLVFSLLPIYNTYVILF